MTRWFAAVWAVAMFALAGCQPAAQSPVFQATDISGAGFARDFRLTDHNGRIRTLADFKGKVVAIFFGYTHCPDVCPTTLSDFAAALKQLDGQAERVQVIFVTLDPQRDTPAILKQYVPAFNPDFLGMYTDADALKQLAKEYKIVYQRTSVKATDDYLIDHSAGTYIYDPAGNLRLLMPYGSSPEAIAHDLRILLSRA
ncbi:MAG: SCO family protein [Thiobacillus sp. 63-78]|uniref:SCO family protein n=1 Tax=Thiobacillus sp. 63-78 TaxID=1895859 RepID=UPI00086DA289|nr:SCO family protein [Thiobacillus sp. 63-78]MBN8763035.1 SCO family protein [Thiobacillus sp.]ODV12775.1 MAG: photosynthetic protein synthase I [Thiobacillus sp. SCN 64-317]MBN8765037.1 SCO family protein [Thiobacillus sp.]MBN8773894.1 SCO family protein [Thiobacillus sp.]OJZ14834.1 MAG: SCO family protein [Thiobacillus sp. 63-78]